MEREGKKELDSSTLASVKGDEKRVHRGSDHDRTNDRNLCILTSDGIFGKHNGLLR
jgi:hypothetical protein